MSLDKVTANNRNQVCNTPDNAYIARGGDVNPIVDSVNTLRTEMDTQNSRNTSYPLVVAAIITATSTSTTTDFGALEVDDTILVLPVAAGTPANTTGSYFKVCATAGTLPAAAVVGNLYVVLRSV